MKPYQEQLAAINAVLDSAHTVVIIQADNPDADSLGSAIGLEHILGDLGKEPVMYCGVDMPSYLHHLSGWDRVQKELPPKFDATIIVDASTNTLLEKLELSRQKPWLATKPCIVLDHHAEVSNPIPFATTVICDASASSTGELIYGLARQSDWPLSVPAQTYLMAAILGDTQGLSNQMTSASTYRVMADMTEAGVNRAALEDARRESGKMAALIFKYKARLIDRAELLADGRLALVAIPQSEISQYSPLYNPAPLIQGDMLQTRGVAATVVLKSYDDGKVTAAIRCNNGAAIAAKLAEHFGGGGHAYASGFKVTDNRRLDEIKAECIRYATELLDDLKA